MKNEIEDRGFALPYRNILYIIAGFVAMLAGYLLMIGGGSDDPDVFNADMFSFRRTVLAPIVILAGIVFEIWAIMHIGRNRNGRKADE